MTTLKEAMNDPDAIQRALKAAHRDQQAMKATPKKEPDTPLIVPPAYSFDQPWDIQLLEYVRHMKASNEATRNQLGPWDKKTKAKIEGYIHAFELVEKRILMTKQTRGGK